MDKCELPLVSVPVGTYNSSSTVIETLESIYNQTYPNIELIVSDDCSTDNTVEICRHWIEDHKDRFARTELLTVERNTGISANCNRAESACTGEWVKGIAGDDILVDDCIESCVKYCNQHEGVVVLFGRQEAFGADETRCKEINAVFDYEMMRATPEEQLHKLIFDRNYIPATTMFYHKERMRQTGVKNDERIPLLEDYPKWINLLKVGVKFHFIDKILVKYRIGGVSTTNKRWNLANYKVHREFYFFYLFDELLQNNKQRTIDNIILEECQIYEDLLHVELAYESIVNSYAYRIGSLIIKPIKKIKNMYDNICHHSNI